MHIDRCPKFDIASIALCDVSPRAIKASISSKEITKNLVRVKSSNIWAYCIDLKRPTDKTGNVYVQFKSASGGPEDIYVYFDVPLVIYRRWLGTPSKGHYFWQYIRGKYNFAKLTGDKRTKQKGGVNSGF